MALQAGRQAFINSVVSIISQPSSDYNVLVNQWCNALEILINSKVLPPIPVVGLGAAINSNMQGISSNAQLAFNNALIQAASLIIASNPTATPPVSSFIFPTLNNPTHLEFASNLFDNISQWFSTGLFIPAPGSPPTPWA